MVILSPKHRHELETGSAIAPDVIAERGYRTITNPRALPLSFNGGQRKLSGCLIPILNTLGENVAEQLKPDNPRTVNGKQPKYEFAGKACLDVPAAARPFLLDVEADLWITEGSKKVDSAVSHGIPCTIGVLGVWLWQKDGNALPDWRDIALKGRVVVLAFDSDVTTKATVRKALDEFSRWLAYRGARVRYCLMPDLPDGKKCGLDDAFVSGLTRADLEALVVDALPAAESDWREPIPFDDPTGPPFPLDALPPKLKTYALAVAEDTGAPVDLVAWCALATIGAATRGRYVVSPKPTWREPVHIQSLQVVTSGGGKSPAYAQVTEGLTIWDIEQATQAKQKLGLWKVKGKTLAAAEIAAQRDANKSTAGTDQQRALEAIQRDLVKHAEEEKPVAQHIVVNDITPQAVWKFLYRQQGSGAAVHPEGGFLRNINRYSDQPVFDPLIEGFSGDGHDLRRAGDEDDEGKVIPRSIFAISLAVQPQVLEDMGQLRGFRELGVSARLLCTFPKPVPTRGDLSISVPDDLRKWWISRTLEIANRADATTYNPKPLPLSIEAHGAFATEYAWYPQAEAEGLFIDMEEWGRKYRGQVLRIAGLLHVLEEPKPLRVNLSGENMRRAIAIMRHAIEHARIAHGIMLGLGTQSNERYMLTVIDLLLDGDPSNVTTSADVYDRVRGRYAFRKADRVVAILQTLEEHRFIRLVRREGPGPKSYTILRNPLKSGCENAKLDQEQQSISHFRRHPIDPENAPPPDIAPAEFLQPTGADGALPGEIRL